VKEPVILYDPPTFTAESARATIADYLARIGKRGGKVGGKSTNAAKAEAARRNGRLGGRPRKAAR
jgi:hypothetical protein